MAVETCQFFGRGADKECVAFADLVVENIRKLGVPPTSDDGVVLDSAIDAIYDKFDLLLHARDLSTIDRLLREVDVDVMPRVLLLAYASITSVAARELTERAPLMARVRKRLEREAPPDVVSALLQGLE